MSRRDAGAPAKPGHGAASLPWSGLAGLGVGFAALSLWILGPALDGAFLSDDYFYIVNNTYVHGLSLDNVLALLDPYGLPTVHTLNYAPVHLLLHAAQWELVGEQTRLYHVTNALAHAGVGVVLALYLARAGVPAAAAALGSLLFVVHPANLETLAWIFQLKTIVALGLSLGALLLHERRPALAAALFALALLTKVTALGVLPVLVVQSWIRSRARPAAPPRWLWVGVWLAIAAIVSVPELAAFQRQGDPRTVIHPDPVVHARTIVAIAARYLWMAFTGLGVAAFHEPPAAESWLDPWWLAGLVGLAAIGARTLRTLREGREEAGLWIFAAAAFAPVSQVFPFIFPMGDRYLYPILPGLIGAALLAGLPAWRQLGARLEARGYPGALAPASAAATVGLALAFAAASHARAPVFVSSLAMMQDSALRYPDGMQANLLRGHQAAREGNAEASARAFERAIDLGFSDLHALLVHPELAGVRPTPAFQRALRRLADYDVARLAPRPELEQSELIRLAIAYDVRGQGAEAEATLERAAAAPGRLADEARRRLARLREDRR